MTTQQSKKQQLKNKRIVITGASMGIGQAVAIKLAQEGAKVVINARGESGLKDTVAKINALGGTVVTSCGSVADYDYCEQLINTCIDEFGAIDGLINCAGLAEPVGSSILNVEQSDWRTQIDVHLHGTFNTCRHAAPIMAKQGYGTLINTSSHAFLGMFGSTGYAAGKGGTNSLSMAIAMDLKAHNINVNCVCPGAKTRLSTGDDYEKIIEDLNQRGLLDENQMQTSLNPPDPSHVAALYAYLMTDAARDISGRIFWGVGGYAGTFYRNDDQVFCIRDHEEHPPWTLEELEKKFKTSALHQPEKLYNVLGHIGPFRIAAKQDMLMAIANSRLVQTIQGWIKKKKR